MQDIPTELDQSKPKGKPPYFFLIPVALGLVGFIGYQTVRMSTAPQATHYTYTVDTSTAAPVHNGTIVVHASVDRAPQRVAAVRPTDRPSATPTPQPSSSPTAGPSASPTPRVTRPAKVKVVSATPVHHAVRHASQDGIARGPVPHFDRPISARAIATVNVSRENTQPAQTVSETATTPPITDAPSVRKEVAASVQIAEVQHQEAAEASAPVNAADHVVDAKMTYAASPDYPEIARDQGVRGTSVVFVTVDPNGSIVHVSIASSSGSALLDRSAVSAARTSRYVAPKVDGKPAMETYRVTYDFAP